MIGVLGYSVFSFSRVNYERNFHGFREEPKYILPFKTWDAQHYLHLAQNGYREGVESNRMFPLYPFSIKALNLIVGNYLLSAFILSTFLSVGCGIMFYKLVLHLFKNTDIATLSVILLFSFPSSFFLSLVYSEALMLFLCLLFFYFYETKRLALSMIVSTFIPLVRPTGIFIIIPLFFFILRSPNKVKFAIQTFNKPLKIKINFGFFYLVFPLLGVALYFGLMQYFLSDPFRGVTGLTQIGNWDLRNVIDPAGMVKDFFRSNIVVHGFSNSAIDRAFFLFFLLMLPFIYKKLSPPYFYFTLVLGGVPIFGGFISYLRYLLIAFPIYIVLADFIHKRERVIYGYIIFFGFILFQGVLFVMHVLNYWVS